MKRGVSHLKVSSAEAGQRLDNFILRHFRQVPKARIYKAIRKGEVRVNKKRTNPSRRVLDGDHIRVPPFIENEAWTSPNISAGFEKCLEDAIVHDDKNILVVNKPTGLAVHGGSGIRSGLIESLRLLFPKQKYLELVHRLDRDTSGLIMLAKKRSILNALHDKFRSNSIEKRYYACLQGKWPAHQRMVTAPLRKSYSASGERFVKVSAQGKASKTEFRVLERLQGATLIEAKPITGRTHQIRVHAQHAGHGILGDTKYRNEQSDELAVSLGLTRLFLHASVLAFDIGEIKYRFNLPLDKTLTSVLDKIRRSR